MSELSTAFESLPSGWQLVRLGDICKTTSGGTPSRKNLDYYNGDIPWVKSGELPDGPVQEIGESVSEDAIKNSSAKVFPCGSLLVAMYGATVGKLGILTRDAATNQAVCAIFPTDNLDNKYLFWYLRAVRSDLVSQAIGGAQPNISQGILRELSIPIAPLEQQIRIVAEIEKQLSRLDEAVANLKRVKANLKRYKAAVLKAAVEGKFTEGTWKPLESAVESIDQGWSPQCDREASTSDERWGVIKTTAVQPQCYLEEENKTLPDTLEPRPGLEIKCDDLLITRAGPRGRVGVSCLVRKTRPKLIMCDKVYRLRCKHDVVTPEYLELVLNAPQIIELLDELKTGISDSGVNLTQGRFMAMELPFPSIPIQDVIVAETERKISVLFKIEREFDANLRRADRLRQSILKQAFSGQLIPQDPNDEPASILLERLRGQQAAPVKASREKTVPLRNAKLAFNAEPKSDTPDYASLDSVISAILDLMQPGREYSRADLADTLGLNTGRWNAAIQELKRRGQVRQVGEKRGARYLLR